MRWILKVCEYGKIESAEIEMAPLTLFVGDNNSGKSYLMSMLWGIQNFGISGLLGREEEEKSREEELLQPEMCLHPQLQQKMARVICQLINVGLGMVVTTHSDIILQHINNMIRLSSREDSADICSRLGYDSADLLNAGQVKVYQLKSLPEGKTRVEELACGENGFVIPTFNDALDRIMEEAYCIQE